MIKFVPTINVSVIGRREGREAWRRGPYRAINNQWWEGDLTPQSSAMVINITLASASPSQSTLLHLDRVYSYINTLNKQHKENTQGYFKLHPYHAKAKASSTGENPPLGTKHASLLKTS